MLWSDVSQNWPNFSDFSSFDKKIPSAVFRLLPTFFFFHISFSVTAETRCISLVSTSYIIHFVTPSLPTELFERALLINLLPSLAFKTGVSNGIRGFLACLACSCISYSCFSNASFSTHNTSSLILPFPFRLVSFIYFAAASYLFVRYLFSNAFGRCFFPSFFLSVSRDLRVRIFASAVHCFSEFCKFLLGCSLMSPNNCTEFFVKLLILVYVKSFWSLDLFLSLLNCNINPTMIWSWFYSLVYVVKNLQTLLWPYYFCIFSALQGWNFYENIHNFYIVVLSQPFFQMLSDCFDQSYSPHFFISWEHIFFSWLPNRQLNLQG